MQLVRAAFSLRSRLVARLFNKFPVFSGPHSLVLSPGPDIETPDSASYFYTGTYFLKCLLILLSQLCLDLKEVNVRGKYLKHVSSV
jgi:hypothetical protein